MKFRFIAYSHPKADIPLKVIEVIEINADGAYTKDHRKFTAPVQQFIDRNTAFGNLVTRETVNRG